MNADEARGYALLFGFDVLEEAMLRGASVRELDQLAIELSESDERSTLIPEAM